MHCVSQRQKLFLFSLPKSPNPSQHIIIFCPTSLPPTCLKCSLPEPRVERAWKATSTSAISCYSLQLFGILSEQRATALQGVHISILINNLLASATPAPEKQREQTPGALSESHIFNEKHAPALGSTPVHKDGLRKGHGAQRTVA